MDFFEHSHQPGPVDCALVRKKMLVFFAVVVVNVSRFQAAAVEKANEFPHCYFPPTQLKALPFEGTVYDNYKEFSCFFVIKYCKLLAIPLSSIHEQLIRTEV